MDKVIDSKNVEIGKIMLYSWEHEWITGEKYAKSVGDSKRLLPYNISQPIYDILQRWEDDLYRTSLPYPPYNLRIRNAETKGIGLIGGEKALLRLAERSLTLNFLNNEWDKDISGIKPKLNRYGKTLYPPSGNENLQNGYEVKWISSINSEHVNIRVLLGKFQHQSF